MAALVQENFGHFWLKLIINLKLPLTKNAVSANQLTTWMNLKTFEGDH